MAKAIQIVGLILIIIGAVLISLSMTMAWNNNNLISFGSAALVIAGIITYVIASRRVIREDFSKRGNSITVLYDKKRMRNFRILFFVIMLTSRHREQ